MCECMAARARLVMVSVRSQLSQLPSCFTVMHIPLHGPTLKKLNCEGLPISAAVAMVRRETAITTKSHGCRCRASCA